jgi:hypothetical protein
MYVGDPKIPGIVKNIYLNYLYKFENLVSFEILPLRLDAAIPAPLPMLETLSKIFNGNAVKGRQRIARTSNIYLFNDFADCVASSNDCDCCDRQHNLCAPPMLVTVSLVCKYTYDSYAFKLCFFIVCIDQGWEITLFGRPCDQFN